jgi:hypothetical protein
MLVWQLLWLSLEFNSLHNIDSPTKTAKVIEQYQAWAQRTPESDLSNPASGFISGAFPVFLNAKERYEPLRAVIDRVNAEMDLKELDMCDVPDFISRVLLLDAHWLTPVMVERAFPGGVNMNVYDTRSRSWAKTLSRVQDISLRQMRDRAMRVAG